MGLFLNKKKSSKESEILHSQLLKEEADLRERLKKQDEQFEAIQKAESSYKETGDIGSLISFWEGLWSSSGPLFNGSKWIFRLPELYMQIEQYDNAIRVLKKIKNPSYEERKQSLLEKATLLKARGNK